MSDLRYQIRQLIKHRTFTLVAVVTLGIGIGANTAIFSVINAVLLRPLPFPTPERLVAIGFSDMHQNTSPVVLGSFSYPAFFDLRDLNRTLSQVAVYRSRSFTHVAESEAESFRGEIVSGEFFDLLGTKPQIGRAFSRLDEQAGGGPGGLKVMISDSLWQRLFDRNPNVLGQTLILNGTPHTVIGVTSAAFEFPIRTEAAELYVTLAEDASTIDGSKPMTADRSNHGLAVIGRLKAGIDRAQATSDLDIIAGTLRKQYPQTNSALSIVLRPLRDDLVSEVRQALYILFGAVLFVLLIANANVANLLLARASARAKEIALRAALGASRSRIIRQLLTESVVLSGFGGTVGLLFANWGIKALFAVLPTNVPRAETVQLDGQILAFTLLISIGTGILFGLIPAWYASNVDLHSALKAGSLGGGGASKLPLRNGLIMFEVALTFVLLVAAGLLIQSFARLSRIQPGLRTDHLLTARITLPDSAYPRAENVTAFFARLLPRIRAIPGVDSASTILPLPLSGIRMITAVDFEEHPLPEEQQPDSPMRFADAEYFKTMGIPLMQGRTFAETDRLESLPVVIVNERFAHQFFPGENPIGKRIKPSWPTNEDPPPMRNIIGVVGNVKHGDLGSDFTPEVYVVASQFPVSSPFLVIRTKLSDPSRITSALRTELAAVDRYIPLTRIQPFDQYLSRSVAGPRFSALLLSIFAGTALLLTAIGIYGVIAYSVAQRATEIGIRIALGAARSSIFRLIIGQAMILVAIGLAIGLVGALAATRVLRNVLYDIRPWDPITFAAIILLLFVIAGVAAWLPAQRASRIDPITLLRAE
jgi:putative ABC transport system permease protein